MEFPMKSIAARDLLRGALVATALLAAAAPAALAADFNPDATIHIGSLYEPQNLDNTAGAGQGINEAFNSNVYEALFQLTDAGTVVPQLVDSYKVSEDGLTYTFKLKPNVTFHSGDKLTSADVKSSIERVTAETSKSSRKSSLKTIASVETPDPETVVIKLSARSISLPYNLSYVWIVDHNAKDITSSEDGTGPYKLGEWRRGSALSLERFDGYWGPKPTNKEVVFSYFTDATAENNALLTGAVDIITSVQSPDSLAQFQNNPAFTVSNGQSTTKLVLAYNDRVKPFDDARVRKAIARAINNKQLLQSIWGNYGSLIGSFVPPTDPWYEDLTGVDPYDPASAKQLLTEAGYPNGFSFTLDTPNYDPHPVVAQFVQSELAKVGITVKINVITANEWYTKVYQKHDFQVTLQEHVNHRDIVFYGDPNFYWGYNNPEVTKLIADSEAAKTTEEQVADLKKANEIISQDKASDWLYLYPQIVVSSSKVTGYPVNGLNSQFFVYGIKKAE
jgi:peptide/nickel transport system substrate-binding protein